MGNKSWVGIAEGSPQIHVVEKGGAITRIGHEWGCRYGDGKQNGCFGHASFYAPSQLCVPLHGGIEHGESVGMFWVVDYDEKHIRQVDMNKGVVSTIYTKGKCIRAMTYAEGGFLIFKDHKDLKVLDIAKRDVNTLPLIPASVKPSEKKAVTDMSRDVIFYARRLYSRRSNRNIVISTLDAIFELTRDEGIKLIKKFTLVNGDYIHGLVVDNDDNIYFAKKSTSTICKLTPGGDVVDLIGMEGSPVSLEDGCLVVLHSNTENSYLASDKVSYIRL